MFCCRGMICKVVDSCKARGWLPTCPCKGHSSSGSAVPLEIGPEEPWPCTIHLTPTHSEITKGSGRDYLRYERTHFEYLWKILLRKTVKIKSSLLFMSREDKSPSWKDLTHKRGDGQFCWASLLRLSATHKVTKGSSTRWFWPDCHLTSNTI